MDTTSPAPDIIIQRFDKIPAGQTGIALRTANDTITRLGDEIIRLNKALTQEKSAVHSGVGTILGLRDALADANMTIYVQAGRIADLERNLVDARQIIAACRPVMER